MAPALSVIRQILSWVGRDAKDVAFAFAGPADRTKCPLGAGVLRIAGAEANQLCQAFIDTTIAMGAGRQERSVGGKLVVVGPDQSMAGHGHG